MLGKKLFNKLKFSNLNKKHLHKTNILHEEHENPLKRTLRILTDDLKIAKRMMLNQMPEPSFDDRFIPRHVDVLIIGGAAIGSSVAYWLKERTLRGGLQVLVVEKDPSVNISYLYIIDLYKTFLQYTKCSSVLSLGGLRQQFSLAENIKMSLYGAEFLRKLGKRFGNESNVFYHPNGYLVLANEDGASQVQNNHRLQREFGAVNCLLSKSQLRERYLKLFQSDQKKSGICQEELTKKYDFRFPWLDVTDIELGCLGLEREGWFHPLSLLKILKKGALDKGASYITGEVIDFVAEASSDLITEGINVPMQEVLKAAKVGIDCQQVQKYRHIYLFLH